MTLTSQQVKAARALLGWSKSKLATRIGVSEKAISTLESGGQWRQPINLDFVRERLEAAGVEFTICAEPGAKLKATKGGSSRRRGRPSRKP
jgi:DNA-binding XRE family transcriptional regulator